MFIEFETSSGATLLNVRHIMQVKRSHGPLDITEIIFANLERGHPGTYQEVCDSLERLVEDHMEEAGNLRAQAFGKMPLILRRAQARVSLPTLRRVEGPRLRRARRRREGRGAHLQTKG